ncbi:ATP-dependent Clp protease proteolytic subunit [Aureimonas phyllosphaerae]|uniref:ATP-dependent Clp protease proteolytic subunit n=1 Tax=Aureimonas phyllosphaerae TaxID=1166078 RepID=A0A7W6BZH8_9HYPH|nr:ATP-dependent Clp protease proteolytic subunit [Aureimonas phyllosphaerae]MBB3938053.1 ATP-dependent Clp protease protease subunit [Aureimonas phyllosphaerae]MBB3962071.1 ATP-dependent Clp protease protease subunit [Aureimonas phyllosphaerae]SFF55073.1 ATP-dependent Clp protease, protease subunit [Aureimonas phyllosphaerae]
MYVRSCNDRLIASMFTIFHYVFTIAAMSYVNLESGIIHVEWDVTGPNTVPFLATLREMDARDDIETITVHVSSTGGANAATLSICQAMRTCRKTVRTIGTGYIASAAVYILAAGTPGHRSIVEGSMLILHGAGVPTRAANVENMSLKELRTYTREMEARLTCLAEEVARLTGQTVDFWKAKIEDGSDWFPSPDEAITLGLADHIIRR